MKKIFLIVGFTIIIIFLVYILNNTNSFSNTNLSEIFQSPNTSTSSSNPNLPFKLPSGFVIDTYTQLSGSPRDLEFDGEKTLFVSLPQAGKIVALIDNDQDGKLDETKDIITSLNNPHGIAYYNNKIFIAQEDKVSRFDWNKLTQEAELEKNLFSLPLGGRHKTRSLVFDNSGRLYVSLGSTCDVCFEKNPWLGSVIISDFEGTNPQKFSGGLRNMVFLTQNPNTNQIWGTEMGRDFLGDNLPPDEINILQEKGDYGWPLCFGNQVYDSNFARQNGTSDPSICQNTIAPIYEIPAHSAPLGLLFINLPQFPSDYQGDLLVAYHGSWNSSTLVGYKVVRLQIENNQIVESVDFITEFIKGTRRFGRPVDLVFDKSGNLYLSDDYTNTIYKIKYLQ